jgi:hypothetical protein
MLRTVLVYDVGACQNNARKLKDSAPRVMTVAGLWMRLRRNASFLLLEITVFGCSPGRCNCSFVWREFGNMTENALGSLMADISSIEVVVYFIHKFLAQGKCL